jgi:hypothetical protein
LHFGLAVQIVSMMLLAFGWTSFFLVVSKLPRLLEPGPSFLIKTDRSLACNKRLRPLKMKFSYHHFKIRANHRTEQVVLLERYEALGSVLKY